MVLDQISSKPISKSRVKVFEPNRLLSEGRINVLGRIVSNPTSEQ